MFIDVAEKIGCITEFSTWIFSEAFKQANLWREKDIHLDVAINLTATEILDNKFSSLIASMVTENKIDKKLVSVEITERVAANDMPELRGKIHSLRENGIKISIDDFGTGYNSLKFIGDVPFDVLKIDKYFIDNIKNPDTMGLILSIIEGAHKLGKMVVAEGIEEEYQAIILRDFGCDYAQGYYFSRPLLPKAFEEFYYKYNKVETNY